MDSWTYNDLCNICCIMLNRLPVITPKEYVPNLSLKELDTDKIDDDIAQAIDHFWDNGEWPQLTPDLKLHLALRFRFVISNLSDMYGWHPEVTYPKGTETQLIASAMTDQWHGGAWIWLYCISGADSVLDKHVFPPMVGSDSGPIFRKMYKKHNGSDPPSSGDVGYKDYRFS